MDATNFSRSRCVREHIPNIQPKEHHDPLPLLAGVGIAAAFLVVASASFSLPAVAWLAFAISIGTLIVSAGIAVLDRRSLPSVFTAVPVALISAWTIVASLVFSETTVQNLALASSLAIAGLAIVGLTAHEVSYARAAKAVRDPSSETDSSTEREGRLAAAA